MESLEHDGAIAEILSVLDKSYPIVYPDCIRVKVKRWS